MWTYVQSSGALVDPDGKIVTYGYSGTPGYANHPEFQNVEDKGPIPRGLYDALEPHDSPDHGPYAMHLVADLDNEMFGRGQFLMHGDSVTHPGTASKGCMIIPRFARERFWESGDHRIGVVKELEIKT